MVNATTFFIIVFAYLLGSIPFGLVLTKIAGLGDIRNIGSGNIGATNVLRTGHKFLAALTLLLDGVKGAAAVLLAQLIDPALAPIAGLASMIGHLFPVWLKFKGGKGVATATGIITALAWPCGLAVMATWILIAKLARYSSLAALVSLGLAPLFVLVMGYGDLLWLTVVIFALVVFTHRANIKRLLSGTEPKIVTTSNATPQA